MRLASYILIAITSFTIGSLYGFYRHTTWYLDEQAIQGFLKITDNTRLEQGNVSQQIELNDIEIEGALGLTAERDIEGLLYVFEGPDGNVLPGTLKMFLLGPDDAYQESVNRSKKEMIKYYRKKPLDFSSPWNCDDRVSEKGQFSCYLYESRLQRTKRINQYVEAND